MSFISSSWQNTDQMAMLMSILLMLKPPESIHTGNYNGKYPRYGNKQSVLADCLIHQQENKVWKILWLRFYSHLIRCPVYGRWYETNTLSSTRKGILSLLHTYYFIASQMLEEERKVIHRPRVTPSSPLDTDFPVPMLVQPTENFASLWGNVRCILPWLVQKWYSALQMFMQQRAKDL